MHDDLMRWIGLLALAYLIGSIPFGLLIGLTRGVDIRRHGSGNIGATNAGRVLGRRIGALCFALDVLKGAAPVLAAGLAMGVFGRRDVDPVQNVWWAAVAAAAVAGHVFPVWLMFKGGKGVATGFGALLAMWPFVSVAASAAFLVWLIGVRLTRYVGISSCIAAICLPVFFTIATMLLGDPAASPIERASAQWPTLAILALLALVVIARHRGNIARTFKGTEPKTDLLTRHRQGASDRDPETRSS